LNARKSLVFAVIMIVLVLGGFSTGYYLRANEVVGVQSSSLQTITDISYESSIITSTLTTTLTNSTNNIAYYWINASGSTLFNGDFQISRASLVSLLNAGNNSIYIIDVRQASGTAGYNTGHIPGAINIPFQNMTAAVTSSLLPRDKILVDVCYTGQTGAMTTTVLRLLGYNAFNLSGGMSGWNNSTRISAAAPIAVGLNYPIVGGPYPGTWTYFNTTA